MSAAWTPRVADPEGTGHGASGQTPARDAPRVGEMSPGHPEPTMNDPRETARPRPPAENQENSPPPVVARPVPRPWVPPGRPVPVTTAAVRQSEEAAWARNSTRLADWVLSRLKVRADAHGAYRLRDGARAEAFVKHEDLTRDRLVAHFRAKDASALVGVHVGSPIDTARFTVVDVDAHGPEADPDRNLRFALHALVKARSARLGCRLLDSDGAGGFHLLIVYPQELPLRDAWRLGKWLAADAPRFGLAAVESFPKSPTLLHSGKGLGGFVRVPGRHHTQPHWSRVWEPVRGRWLDGGRATGSLLDLYGSPTPPGDVPPPGFLPAVAREGARRDGGRTSLSLRRDVARARSALEAIGEDYLEPYEKWIQVGMSLRGLGPDGLRLWHDWSSRSAKYDARALDGRWDGFASESPGARLVGLATLFHVARAEGWVDPERVEFESDCGASVSWAGGAITIRLNLEASSQGVRNEDRRCNAGTGCRGPREPRRRPQPTRLDHARGDARRGRSPPQVRPPRGPGRPR